MATSVAESPPTRVPKPPVSSSEPPPPTRSSAFSSLPRRLGVRLTTEFDSDSSSFFHKVSYKLFDNLAKLKLSFRNNNDKGEILEPRLNLISKHLILNYDLIAHNALVNSSFDVAPGFRFRGAHDVKAQQGDVAIVADLAGPAYQFELSSALPPAGPPRATFKFPLGQVSLQEKQEEEVKPILSMNGIAKSNLLDGVCTAQYTDGSLNLRYLYKDKQMTFAPKISLPSNALSFAFKRQLGPSEKLSYWYNFFSNFWSSVYKHRVGKDYKLKIGYDSEVRLGWASLWVGGDECTRVKTAPGKMKTQFMLQVPQDDIKASALMFRVKKRWDI